MALEHDSNTVLAQAVRAAGSQSAFGRWIGKAQSTVNDWLRENKDLPPEHVLTVERMSGISRHDLRPDIYPRDSATPVPATPVASGLSDRLAPQR